MKARREKEIATRKQMEEDKEKAKLLVKDRLMALDLKAISAASKVRHFGEISLNRGFCDAPTPQIWLNG